jgi:hypothetical protein
VYIVLGRISDPSLNDKLHYPDGLEGPLNEVAVNKIRQYPTDYNNCPSNAISFMSVIGSTSGHLHCEFVYLLLLQDHRETDRFSETSGVHLAQSNTMYHYRRAGVLLLDHKLTLLHNKQICLRHMLGLSSSDSLAFLLILVLS